MRLGQLSRQLEVPSDKIVKVLAEQFREVNNHPNIKIKEEELAYLVTHFKPIQDDTEPTKEITPVEAAEEVIDEAPESEVKEENEVPEFVESLRPQVITLEEEFNAQKEDLEAYKAEKVELEGLKVVGKIDLPEPIVKKKKEEEPKAEEESEVVTGPRRDRNRGRRNQKRKPRLSKPEYERQKAAKAAQRKKEEEAKKKKEQKKKYYQDQVQSKQTTVAKKKKKKPPVIAESQPQSSSKQAASTPQTKNPVKRFWLWLNGAYDKN